MPQKGPLPLYYRAIGAGIAIGGAAITASKTLTPSTTVWTGNAWCIVCGAVGGVDVFLNLLLFLPVGLGLGILGVRPWRAIAIACAYSIGIETLQLLVVVGRDASIGDVLMNTIGGAIGFAMGRNLEHCLWPRARIATRLMGAWLAIWMLVHVVTSYAFTPALSSLQYYGQLGRALGNRPAYSGRVISASLDGEAIPNTRYEDSRRPRDLLSQPGGALVEVGVVPRRWTTWTRSIARIADADQQEMLQVAEYGSNLIFGIRTGADVLRLRPARFVLRDVFPNPAAGDTIRVRARYDARTVTISAEAPNRFRNSTMPLTIGNGWRLVYPVQTYMDAMTFDTVMRMLWMGVLTLLIGYWFPFVIDRVGKSRGRAVPVFGGVLAILLACGLVLVPALYGISASGWPELAGTAGGIAVGAAIAGGVKRWRATLELRPPRPRTPDPPSSVRSE